jgi:DNA-binding Lrp family transcriptional regulator
MISLALWRLSHLSLTFLLDIIALSRAGGDIVDASLLAAIVQANVAPINQEPTLQIAYATLDAVAPDEFRRPVSVNAVAEMLDLPFETVRRRIGRLARKGACVITPRGVLVPQAALATPEYEALILARNARLQRFYFDLRAIEVLSPIDGASGAPQPKAAPVRAADRLLGDYVMRFVDCILQRIGDPLTGLVLLDMARANIEHLTVAEVEATIPIADSQRRPVPNTRLAQRLNIPIETLRRRVLFLEREGFCRRTRQGSAVLSAGIGRPGVTSLFVENAANVQRLFTQLDRLGILAAWDRGAPAAQASAPMTAS